VLVLRQAETIMLRSPWADKNGCQGFPDRHGEGGWLAGRDNARNRGSFVSTPFAIGLTIIVRFYCE
jgi:hypothetical protein